ncbi:MAG: hypothetical protein U0324_44335 [Polyangiales bacterium]
MKTDDEKRAEQRRRLGEHLAEHAAAAVDGAEPVTDAVLSESRLVDTANHFHLWALPEGGRVPFGYDRRMVADGSGGSSVGGAQRPFEEGQTPPDAEPAGALFARYQRAGSGR